MKIWMKMISSASNWLLRAEFLDKANPSSKTLNKIHKKTQALIILKTFFLSKARLVKK